MANAAIIHTDGGGSVQVGGAHVETKSEVQILRTVALTMENARSAVPDAGPLRSTRYSMRGTIICSTEQTYGYVPLGPLRHIYPVFMPAKYSSMRSIPPTVHRVPGFYDYSFDATVQGNGNCATLNIMRSGFREPMHG